MQKVQQLLTHPSKVTRKVFHQNIKIGTDRTEFQDSSRFDTSVASKAFTVMPHKTCKPPITQTTFTCPTGGTTACSPISQKYCLKIFKNKINNNDTLNIVMFVCTSGKFKGSNMTLTIFDRSSSGGICSPTLFPSLGV